MKLAPKYTHEEHVELAKDVCRINDELHNLFYELQNRYGKSSRMCKKLQAAIKAFGISVRSQLDDEYHKVTSGEQFVDKGHVYYNSNHG